jgi:valyl-tRNA synthetase
MMQPKLAKKIEQTRDEFADGIASYGTDALRFTFCSLASTGRDIKFDMGRVEGYRNFCNKIWNAARYVLDKGEDCGQNGEAYELSLADRWIISQLQRTEAEVTRQLDQFRFDLAAQALYEFIWNQYCDWYLELSKPVLWDETPRSSASAAPVAPWCACWKWPAPGPSVHAVHHRRNLAAHRAAGRHRRQDHHAAALAGGQRSRIDQAAEDDIEWLKGLMLGTRNIRGEMNIGPGKPLPLFLKNASAEDQRRLTENEALLKKLAKSGIDHRAGCRRRSTCRPPRWSARWKCWCRWPA